MKKDDSIRQLGIWESLKQATRVHLPGIVVEEARYYIDDYRKWGLDLQAQADSSEIEVLSATLEQMRSVIRDFVPAFSFAIDDDVPDLVFCTGDIKCHASCRDASHRSVPDLAREVDRVIETAAGNQACRLA
jgi:hypothetical protein